MVFLGGAVLANIVSHRFLVPATDSPSPFCFAPSLKSLSMQSIQLTAAPQMADKENMWITKQEWEEQGARALEKLGKR